MPARRKRKTVTKPKLITTIEMEVAIAKYFGVRQNIIVPNISWGLIGMHECDMFIIKKSGYVTEVEIKRSKTDLLADFKKGHNHIDRQNRISELYYALPIELYESCKDLIPENSGILTCEKYHVGHGTRRVGVRTQREPVKIKNARKLTEVEKLKIATLGTMRIWSLKEKIIKSQNGRSNI
jgi:hypothetical protein